MTQDREETAAMRTVLVVVDTLNDFMRGVLGSPAAKRLYSTFTETGDRLPSSTRAPIAGHCSRRLG
jgi:hypothetical protein